MNTNILKGAIYCRVSTDDQESNGMSLPQQKDANLKFARDNNLHVDESHIFTESYSGAFLDRPQLSRVFSLASKGLIDFVILTKRDRAARDQWVFQSIMKQLNDANVKVFYSEEKLTGDIAMDNFMGSTIVGFAAWEREQIKTRTMKGRRQHAKNNKWPFSNIPFGYIRNQETKELEIYEPEKDIILETVRLFLVENMSLCAIAKKYSEDGIAPPSLSLKGGTQQKIAQRVRKNAVFHWSETTVFRILNKATMYTGVHQSFVKEYKKEGERTVIVGDRPKEEWIEIKIPQILTVKQAQSIAEKMQHNRTFSKKRSVRTYLLQGKLLCDCDPIYHNFAGYSNFHKRLQKDLKNYRCSKYNLRKMSDDRRCSNHISGLKIEGVIIDTLKELFMSPEYIFTDATEEYILQVGGPKKQERYHDLEGLILDLEKKLRKNEDLHIEGLIPKNRFIARKNEMEEKIESFRKEQEKELDIIKNTVGREVAIKTWSEIAESLREMTELFFQYATYEELKDLVNLVIDKVIVPVDKEQSVKIRLKLPFRIELAERYMEEEMEIIQDECGMNHILGPTGKIIPKKFNLDPTKNPLKYRTVEFKDGDDDEGKECETRFLDLLKKAYYQPYKSDQEKSRIRLSKTDFVFLGMKYREGFEATATPTKNESGRRWVAPHLPSQGVLNREAMQKESLIPNQEKSKRTPNGVLLVSPESLRILSFNTKNIING